MIGRVPSSWMIPSSTASCSSAVRPVSPASVPDADVVSPPVLPAPELLELFPQPASMLVTIRLASNTDTIFFFILFLLYFAAFFGSEIR